MGYSAICCDQADEAIVEGLCRYASASTSTRVEVVATTEAADPRMNEERTTEE